MADWFGDLTQKERKQWDRFVDGVRRDALGKIADSAFMMSLVPHGETDIKFAVELGLGIMLDKPIVALATRGVEVPPGLRRVAHAIIEVDDIDTEDGQKEVQRRLAEIMEGLGLR